MDSLANLIGGIYDCSLEGFDWTDTITSLADFCAAENAALVIIDPRIGLSSVTTPRADPAVVEAYNSFWWQHDPTAAMTASIAPGIVTDLSVTGRETYFSSSFYGDFWARSGLGSERIASNLFTDNGSFSSIVLQAGTARDEISDDSRDRFALLLPHLQRAIAIKRRILEIEIAAVRATHPGHSGLVTVDATGLILHIDDQALAKIEALAGIGINNGRFSFSDAGNDSRFGKALQAACDYRDGAGKVNRIDLPSGPGPAQTWLEILPNPLGTAAASPTGNGAASAIVLLHDTADRKAEKVNLLIDRFGLTQAEARLAVEIAKGDGREAAAQRCGISVNTARSHLSKVFDKAEVKRQAELIRLLYELGIE